MVYNREAAAAYAIRYALTPNPNYIYYSADDCTNFISQCLRAGGANNDFNRSHPWWYLYGKNSVCWSVAQSLFWYIRVCSEEKRFGIKADTYYLDLNNEYESKIEGKIFIGDLIQYKNAHDNIVHSSIITGFDSITKEPLISQHHF
ncbi:MAG: amidase domain-containing protein [Eubacteriales bacterium]